MKYISMREHDENGRTFTSSIMQDDSGNILINVDGHQIVLDDARCIALKEMLEIWQKKNKVEFSYEVSAKTGERTRWSCAMRSAMPVITV